MTGIDLLFLVVAFVLFVGVLGGALGDSIDREDAARRNLR